MTNNDFSNKKSLSMKTINNVIKILIIYHVVAIIASLFSNFILTTGNNEWERQIYGSNSLTLLIYKIIIVTSNLILIAFVFYLYKRKKEAYYIFLAYMLFMILSIAYLILATDWLQVLKYKAIVGTSISMALIIAIFLFLKHLYKRNILN